MFTIETVVEELVEHLKVVRLVTSCFKFFIFEVFSQELLPLIVFEIQGHII